MQWTETNVASALAFGALNSKSVLVIPNCGWTGSECDLLVIEKGLRIIDVEIKVSRSDLKADYNKDKWWGTRPWSRRAVPGPHAKREWPAKVWKHYYAIPLSLWNPDLIPFLPPASGVIGLRHNKSNKAGISLQVVRRATPNRDAKPISPVDAIDLARLASLRMWSALRREQT